MLASINRYTGQNQQNKTDQFFREKSRKRAKGREMNKLCRFYLSFWKHSFKPQQNPCYTIWNEMNIQGVPEVTLELKLNNDDR